MRNLIIVLLMAFSTISQAQIPYQTIHTLNAKGEVILDSLDITELEKFGTVELTTTKGSRVIIETIVNTKYNKAGKIVMHTLTPKREGNRLRVTKQVFLNQKEKRAIYRIQVPEKVIVYRAKPIDYLK